MSISITKFILNKKKVKNFKKRSNKIVDRCNHCGGAFKGSDQLESCIMCGRDKGHTCSNCLNAPIEKVIQEKA